MFCAVLAWCRVRFVRFAADERAATTLRLLADCEAADPQSKGIVEHLVGYAKSDLVVPGIDGAGGPFGGLVAANVAAAASCTQVDAARHSEICAVPVERQLVRRPGHEHLRVLSAALRVEPGQVRVPTRQRGRFSWPRLPSAWRMLRAALQLIHRIRTFAPRLAPRSSIRSPGACAFGHSPP